MFNIHMLPASFGDSLLIEYGEPDKLKYILIDGGPYYQFDEIVKTLKDVVPDMKEIELLVVTHVDIDHIDGTIRLLNHEPPIYKIKKVWFNNYEDLSFEEPSDLLGGIQGEYLNILVDKKDLEKNEKPITIHRKPDEINFSDELQIQIVNPTQAALKDLVKKWDKHLDEQGLEHDEQKIWEVLNGDKRYEPLPADLLGEDDKISDWAEVDAKEDKSEANRSSIAFIITYKGKSCLMSGDVPSKDLKANLEKLGLLDEFGQIQLDAWKLSHHGSKKSTQAYLMEIIQARKVLVSSDGKRYRHPDKETIAKLLVANNSSDEHMDIYFNYTSSYNKIWGDSDTEEKFECTFHFPEEEGYMKVELLPEKDS